MDKAEKEGPRKRHVHPSRGCLYTLFLLRLPETLGGFLHLVPKPDEQISIAVQNKYRCRGRTNNKTKPEHQSYLLYRQSLTGIRDCGDRVPSLCLNDEIHNLRCTGINYCFVLSVRPPLCPSLSGGGNWSRCQERRKVGLRKYDGPQPGFLSLGPANRLVASVPISLVRDFCCSDRVRRV